MSRVAYVNGQYHPHGQATIHVEDRGFQFADGVYEVWAVLDGRLADFEGHMTRLARSLTELRIAIPMTRETARRDHPFPPEGTPPSVIVTARSLPLSKGNAAAKKGVAVVTHPDIRWGRCDIKTVMLLPNVLASQQAREAGAMEAILVRDGIAWEGTKANLFTVSMGVVRTAPRGPRILPGVTRAAALEAAAKLGYPLEERPLGVDELFSSDEVFLASTTLWTYSLVEVDGRPVGGGQPGPVAARIREVLQAEFGG